MTLPAPRYTTRSLDPYLAATGVPLPLPPEPPERWTCVLRELGPGVLLDRSARGVEACDPVFLRALVAATGRPTRTEEQEALLLTAPIPAGSLDGALTALLTHSSYWVRQNALLCLASRGRPHPGMRAALRDRDNDVRRAAAEALGRTGDRGSLPLLVGLDADSDPSVDAARVQAMVALQAWAEVGALLGAGPEGDSRSLLEVLLRLEGGAADDGALLDVLTGPDADLRRAAAAWLWRHPSRVGRHAEALVAAVAAQPGFDEHLPVARALGAAGEDGVDAVVEALEHEDWQVRAWACAALAWAGEAARPVESTLVARLDDDDGDVQREAALALAAAGCRVDEMRRRIGRILTREHHFLGRAAACAPAVLGAVGAFFGVDSPGPRLIPVLATSGDDKLRGLAALVLALQQPDSVAPLLEAMARDDARDVPLAVRRHCAAGLLLAAEPPALLGAVHRPLLAHTGDAGGAVGGGLDGLAPLADELATLAVKDGDWQVRIDCMRLVQRLGADGAPYHQIIAWQSRHDPDADVRRVAAEVAPPPWGRSGSAHTLVELLQPPRGAADDDARGMALRRLLDEAPELAASLAAVLVSSDTRAIARAAGVVLGASVPAGDAGREVVALAVARLEDSAWTAREAACDLLGAVPATRLDAGLREEVVEALRVRHGEDYDEDVRSAAAEALRALGAAPAPDPEAL